jgi:hypothetical protein
LKIGRDVPQRRKGIKNKKKREEEEEEEGEEGERE